MSSSEHLLASLRAAVAAAPDDVELRLHLADLLVAAGERGEAVREAAQVLVREPGLRDHAVHLEDLGVLAIHIDAVRSREVANVLLVRVPAVLL